MPLTDVNSLGAADKMQEFQHIVVVVERLARAHQHDIRNLFAAVFLHEQNLVQNFTGREVSLFSVQAGGAEFAAHAAADLRGNADRNAVLVVHEDGLHTVAVPQPPEVLYCTVYLAYLLACDLGHGQDKVLRKPCAQVFREVAHLIEGGNALVQPLEDLTGAERLLAHLLQGGFQFIYC